MKATETTAALLVEVGQLLATLRPRISTPEAFQSMAAELGWDISDVPAPIAALLAPLDTLHTSLQLVVQAPTVATVEAVYTAVRTLYTQVRSLATEPFSLGFDPTDFKADFPPQLLSLLLIDYLARFHPRLYAVLRTTGLIEQEFRPILVSGPRLPYMRKSFNLHLLADLLRDPTTLLTQVYGYGTSLLYEKLVLVLADTFARLGFPTAIKTADYDLLASVNAVPMPFPEAMPLALEVNIFDTFAALGHVALNMDLLPVLAADGSYEGLGLAAQASGAIAEKIALNKDFALLLAGSASLTGGVGLKLVPGQPVSLTGLGSNPSPVQGKLEVALVQTSAVPLGGQRLLLNTPGNTRLSYESITWKAGAATTTASCDLYTELKIKALRFASGEGDNDSFLSQVLKNFYFKTDLSVGISKAKGFYFDSAGGLSTKQLKNIKLGPVQLNNVAFAVATDNTTSFTYLTVVSDLVADLGPIKASLSGVGLKAGIKYDANGGDIGPFSTDIAVQGPSGISIAVKSDKVSGGGYLFLDPAKHTYAGAANLAIDAGTTTINVNALGILQTELPGYPDEYSLLLLLTATFAPIELGLGFTLRGLGGLLGVNRQSSVDYLRGMVRQGQLKQLLFADDVMSDPTAALALVDAAFPVARGRYVIGLMAQLGWGAAANLITLDVALLVELPQPVRVLLLGVLQAVLPNEKNEKLKLRADFLGVVDLGAKKVSFDASLSDSHILDFALTGDMAFRLYQGDNPLFVITAGGFHPSFQPPADAALTGLRRLTLALNKDDLRLTLASYYAVTSNTVQFGAHLDLTYQLGHGFHVEGHFGFDVLFQFSPFHLLAHFEAGVAIKRGDSDYLSLHLSLDVDGPGPWHIWGEASFRVLGWKIGIDVNATIGSRPTETTLPAPNVHTLLLEALRQPASWEVEAPTTALPGGVVLRPAAPAAGQLFLDPRGALVLRQRVAPLGTTLEKYGSAPTAPTGGTYFELTRLQVGPDEYTLATAGTPLEVTRDFFAPDQFLRLTDAQRLSSPSFQRLPNGLRLKRLNGLVAAPQATRRVVEYEKKLLDGTSGGSTLTSQGLGATTFGQLARGGALGQALQQAQPSARAAQPITWGEDTYEVVDAATLLVYDAAYQGFKTQAEAAQYGQALAAADATREVLVVPTYQLALA